MLFSHLQLTFQDAFSVYIHVFLYYLWHGSMCFLNSFYNGEICIPVIIKAIWIEIFFTTISLLQTIDLILFVI